MKSAVFYGTHDIRIEERRQPVPAAHEVLVRVKMCGICGTDVHIYEGDEGAAPTIPPLILGHEFSGVIEAVGREVHTCQPGDAVCIDPNRYCGTCEPCRNGMAHFCTAMKGYGTTTDGGFAEFCKVDEQQVYKLGQHTSFIAGAMAEPAACCLHGIDMCEITPGAQAVIIGGGMIGQLMIQLAKLKGAAKVALIEPIAEKRQLAAQMGADICIDPFHEDVPLSLLNQGFTHISAVIECVGRSDTIEQAISIAGSKAIVMMFGLTRPGESVSLKPFHMFQKELTLKASYINPYTQKRALDLIDSGKLKVEELIHEICELEQLNDILKDPQKRAAGKYVISL